MNKSTIAAVVVTYNRLNLLKNCLDALRGQTKKIDKIIVINNGSTDDTFDWLESQNDLVVIHQENLGGSGGFYTGMKYAVEHEYEWVWLMDDDGYPSQDCLNILYNGKGVFDVVAPLVVDIEDISKLAFKGPDNSASTDYIRKNYSLIENYACFFNGVLIKSQTINSIGYPIKELFIWGDEREYFYRIRNSNFKICTNTAALFHHPKDRLFDTKFLGIYVFTGLNNWKAYCYYRNNAYINYKFNQSWGILTILKQALFNIIRLKVNSGIKANLILLKASIDGVRGNLSKKLPY